MMTTFECLLQLIFITVANEPISQATNSSAWMTITGPWLPRPDGFMSAAHWNNMIYLLGGRIYKKQVVAYNITNNSFTDYGENVLSGSHMSWGQSYTQLNNLFFKFGPSSLAGNKLVIYDLTTLSFWNSPTNIISPVTVLDEPCLAVNDDYLFVIGGIVSFIEVLNISSYSWIDGIPKPNNNRARSACIIDNDNKLYAVGGLDGSNILSSIECIQVTDIKQNAWHYIGNLTEIAYGIRCILFGNFIYVLGGYNSNGGQIFLHTIHRINTITASVSLLPDTLSNPALATVIVDGIFYGFGGTITTNSDLDTWIRYELPNITTFDTNNPTTDQPTTIAPTTSNPTTDNPTTTTPTTTKPTTSIPTTSIPTTSIPTTSIPTTKIPTTSNPTTANPTTAKPTTANPTPNPTTSIPTTKNPTIATPTTTMPTTTMPTTTMPTTTNPSRLPTSKGDTQHPTSDPSKEPTISPSTFRPSSDPELAVSTTSNVITSPVSGQPTSIPTAIYDDLLFICYYNDIRDYIDMQYAQIMEYQVVSTIISLTSSSWDESQVKSLEICKIFSDTRLTNKCPSYDISTQVNAQYVAIGLLTITSDSQLDEYKTYLIDLIKWSRFREEFNINMNKALIDIDATNEPSWSPSINPTYKPTSNPSVDPTKLPTSNPSNVPTTKPSLNPTYKPTQDRRRNLLANSFESILIDIVDLNNITLSDGSGSGNNEENTKSDNTLIIIIVIVIILSILIVITLTIFYYYRQKKPMNKGTITDTKMAKEIEMNQSKQENKMKNNEELLHKEGMEGNLYETPRPPPRVNDIDKKNGNGEYKATPPGPPLSQPNDEYVPAPMNAVKSNEESEDSLDIIQHQMLSQEINEYEDKITAGQ